MLNSSFKRSLCNSRLFEYKYIPLKHFSNDKINSINKFQKVRSELASSYIPHVVEKEEFKCDYFRPKVTSDKPFTLLLPPPNITGTLHLGHALTATIQDVMVRWKRMEGIETVWIPGIDHAGIATQVVVEKLLWKEKRVSRHEVGREAFQERIWKWKEEKASVIETQLKRLGVSLNWSKFVFTMEPSQSKAVSEAFVRLFDNGLVYRADHPVNWSCHLRSAISDIEVEHLEIEGPTLISVPSYEKPVEFGVLTRFAYKLQDSDEEIVVATTRPETMLGDVAVAVNPRDERYGRFVGRRLWHPFGKRTFPIIVDDFVDPAFGTGAVKVTPAHDPVDFQVAKRHQLDPISVIDEGGNLTFGGFSGMRRFDAREAILSHLEGMGLLRGREGHAMVVPVCSRSRDVVETLVRPQWFIKCREMAKRATDDVREGRLVIEPAHFEKNWFSWLDNIRDWCVSRQLWWGHQIPAYYCEIEGQETAGVWTAAAGAADARLRASRLLSAAPDNIKVRQEEDVLDTWFSSALLPFTASGWPQQDSTPYYPLSLMETGHDILFFWVARMVMLGTELTGKLPFPKVLLHGIICDAHGRKMSKSAGNVVAPEEVIQGATLEALEAAVRGSSGVLTEEEAEGATRGRRKMFPQGIPECGADALRFTLCSHNVKSHFINFDVQECHTNKLFCNKIWQATKYVNTVMQKIPEESLSTVNFDELSLMDRWILSKLTYMIQQCRTNMELSEFHVVTAAIKNFLYYEFCDIYLEATKRAFRSEDESAARGHRWTLTTALDAALRAAAPFMPRLTQHLHRRLQGYPGMERTMEYPKNLSWRDENLEGKIEDVMEIVVAIRRMKKMFGVVAKHQPEAYIASDYFIPFAANIEDLSKCYKITIASNTEEVPTEDVVSDRVGVRGISVFLRVPPELKEAFNLDLQGVEKKMEKLAKELEKMNKMVKAENYKVKATAESQRIHAKKIASLEEKLARLDYIRTLSAQ